MTFRLPIAHVLLPVFMLSAVVHAMGNVGIAED